MEMRYPSSPDAVERFTTAELRDEFLIETLFADGAINMVYSHIDRVIVGGAVPTNAVLALAGDPKELGADFFLQRRELGIVCVSGGAGTVTVDGTAYAMDKLDGLYVGMGVKDVSFASVDAANPAHFYFVSTPAHQTYPTAHIPIKDAEPQHLGDPANSNKRTIYKYIHPAGVQSCQLVLGVTLLAPNNMWNTMPAHTHARRMEVYLYFDIAGDNVVFHLMGQPDETRHLIMRNEQAAISPSWSIHAGMGTVNYSFVWAMAGENQTFSDMDGVSMTALR
ncbi:MAG: 5-dehydro-4-deoxy-D-glucuronate isomerase [Anaerolineae bacterium]|nr:5-dehydro-4-deoxy-D-glucuronate isomerase [Anaerolineae bacterium]